MPQRHGSAPGQVGFVLLGHATACRNARDVLVAVVEGLAARDASFLDRFVALPKHGRTRRYIAKDRNELYPGRPDLADEFSEKLKSGYWVGVNASRRAIEQIIVMASEVAGVRYGVDLKVNLGE